uniref:Uncharacterized protein n=1 Tax=Romanomermis culicivorax TaxID=13658 RepID=A0A915L669_ROMCU
MHEKAGKSKMTLQQSLIEVRSIRSCDLSHRRSISVIFSFVSIDTEAKSTGTLQCYVTTRCENITNHAEEFVIYIVCVKPGSYFCSASKFTQGVLAKHARTVNDPFRSLSSKKT